MKNALIITSIAVIITIFSFSFSITHAQIQPSVDGVTISSNPTYPAPLEEVTISIESYSVDLNSASIVWLVDGRSIKNGIGMKEFKVNAPKLGKKTNVETIIIANGGREIRKTITLKSASVDIVWESKGYTPPFFKGRNPLSYQNDVRFTAIPHISLDGTTEINPKNLVYEWKRGGKYIDGATGYGKQSVDIKADDVPKPIEITVSVNTRDQSETVIGELTLEPSEPSISFYEVSPLYGILFNKALGDTVTLTNSEITILGVPFGFTKNYINYNWSINDSEQPDLTKNQSITLKSRGETDGSSNISLEVSNLENILQGAKSSFNILFKKKTESIDNSIIF